MKLNLPLVIALLAAACTAAPPVQPPSAATAATDATEDERLVAFLDAAFDAQAELDPQTLTTLGHQAPLRPAQ